MKTRHFFTTLAIVAVMLFTMAPAVYADGANNNTQPNWFDNWFSWDPGLTFPDLPPAPWNGTDDAFVGPPAPQVTIVTTGGTATGGNAEAEGGNATAEGGSAQSDSEGGNATSEAIGGTGTGTSSSSSEATATATAECGCEICPCPTPTCPTPDPCPACPTCPEPEPCPTCPEPPTCPTCPACPTPDPCEPEIVEVPGPERIVELPCTQCTEVVISNPTPGTEWAYENPPETEGAVFAVGIYGTVSFWGNTGSNTGGTLTEESLALLAGLLPEGEALAQVRLSCSPFYPENRPEQPTPICYETTSRYAGFDPRAGFHSATIIAAEGVVLYDGTAGTELGFEASLGIREDGFFTVDAKTTLVNGMVPGYVKRYPIPESGRIADIEAVDGRSGVPVTSVVMGDLVGIDKKYDAFMASVQAQLDAIVGDPELVPLYVLHVEDSERPGDADFRVSGRTVDIPDLMFIVYGREVDCP